MPDTMPEKVYANAVNIITIIDEEVYFNGLIVDAEVPLFPPDESKMDKIDERARDYFLVQCRFAIEGFDDFSQKEIDYILDCGSVYKNNCSVTMYRPTIHMD